jgi:hypothetical protein
MKEKKKLTEDDENYDWVKDDMAVIDYMTGTWELYKGRGLEEALKAWKSIPRKDRTESDLEDICRANSTFEFDRYDPPDWMPNL